MFRLRIIPPTGEPFERLCGEGSLTVGGSPTADLVIADPGLSRLHIRFFQKGSSLAVENLGKPDSASINGRPFGLAENLTIGDTLELGESKILVISLGFLEFDKAPLDKTNSVRSVYRSLQDLLPSRPPEGSELTTSKDVRRYLDRLELINEVHGALGRAVSLGELLKLIISRLSVHLKPQEALIFLKSPDGSFVRAASHFSSGLNEEFPISRSLIKAVVEDQAGVLVFDAQADERFILAESIQRIGIRSIIAAPLLDEAEALGMIVLTSRDRARQFTEEDRVFRK